MSSNILKRKQEITQFAAIKVSKTKRELIDAGHQVIKIAEYIACSNQQKAGMGIRHTFMDTCLNFE